MSTERKIRVVLVDDVPELRLLVRLTLEDDPGIEVVGEAWNGREGVRVVEETSPDLVLLDLSMPDMDGLEAIPLMRERAPLARVVVLSGHEAGRLSLQALGQGASRYVNKASGLATIPKVVHEVARLEPPFTDERFGVVRSAWELFVEGQIDRVLENATADVQWRPYVAPERVLKSREEARAFIDELLARGRIVDPRAYGVEPRREGLVVLGTLEIRGPGGIGETEVFWAFCFQDNLVSMAAGFDSREEALQRLAECAA
ncbi:MAG TPA: response regulator transcription factor [Thermoleophilaceae bacterium]|jgi:DNA-binding NarL/FixJ family response regulator|nr:response regulator transcription factor [Thermoleophilaceae bacterium]